jgi:hypothetical protein
MLDVRTLLLSASEDCYAPSRSWRQAERLLFPLLSGAAPLTPVVLPEPPKVEVLQRS